MATLTTSTSNFSNLVTALVIRRSEDILAANYVHLNPANGFNRATIIKGTNQLTFPAIAQLAATTTALSEGTAPTAQALTIATDTVTAAQMGWTVQITDLALLESPLDMIQLAADRIADQAANSMDVVVRDILGAGTSVKYSNGSARSAVSANITGSLVKQLFWNLRKGNVPLFPDGTYHAIVSPNQAYDIEADTASGGWMDTFKYTNNEPLLSGEVGRYAGVRFMVTSNAKIFSSAGAASVDVHSATFFGPEAYAVGDLQSLQARYVPPGGDHSDPLGQAAIIGAKVALGGALLIGNGPRYRRLETAASTV